jgi:putative DNA methylase
MTDYRTKLIEVALPVEEINKACRRDKDRKVGTIKNVHKWFAPMPTPAWRALLFAALVDDPGEPRRRTELVNLIKRLVPEDGGPPEEPALAEARRLLHATGELPVVFDPFCGGGSTLVEAQRLGMRAAGSDLNPVAVLITRTLTQLIPGVRNREPLHPGDRITGVSGGPLDGLITDLRYYAARVRQEAWRKAGHLYPTVDGGTVIAWLWARTVTCANPACGATIPLYTSPWLSKRRGEKRWLKPVAVGKHADFEIGEGDGPPPPATKASARGAKFRCLSCAEPTPEAYVKAEGEAGRLGIQLLAVVADGAEGRRYLPADENQRKTADVTVPDDSPELPLPNDTRSFSPPVFGLTTQADLYTPRQLHALGAFADAVAQVPGWVTADGGDEAYAIAIASILGLCVGKLAQTNSTQARWYIGGDTGTPRVQAAFGRHALPMVWDFTELNPFSDRIANWLGMVDSLISGIQALPVVANSAVVAQCDARDADRLVKPGSALVATDPPYFDHIGYADLSDYFYVWERRALRNVHPDLFGTIAAPKDAELIATPYRHGGDMGAARRYFVDGFTQAFTALRRAARPDLPAIVIYAHRQEETGEGGLTSTAWDAIIEALLEAGLGVAGTWPIHGTGSTRQIGLGTNALASYTVMVCRPRRIDAAMTDRPGFLRALRAELPPAIRKMQDAAIPALDLTQAALGPGLAVFSRFAQVVEPSGEPMSVRTAIGLINQVRSEVLTEQQDEFDPATRWAVQWFDEYDFGEGPYDRAEVLFTGTDTAFDQLRRAGIIDSRPSKVRLVRPDELPDNWEPDGLPSVWGMTMHLVQRLDRGGEEGAARLLAKAGPARDAVRDLAYRLADICERKRRPKEALMFDGLIISWPEISKRATGKQDVLV